MYGPFTPERLRQLEAELERQKQIEDDARLRAMDEYHRQERERQAREAAEEEKKRLRERVIRRDEQEQERLRTRKIALHKEAVRSHVAYGPRQTRPRPVTKLTGLVRKRGRYARSKIKLLWVLCWPEKCGLKGDCFPIRQLCVEAGIPIRSLTSQLPSYEGGKWVKTRLIDGVQNRVYGVSLGPRGLRYAQICQAQLRNYRTFAAEFAAWREHLKENGLGDYLRTCPYEECAAVLSREVKLVNSQFDEWVS